MITRLILSCRVTSLTFQLHLGVFHIFPPYRPVFFYRSYRKNEDISGWKTHKNIQKLHWNVSKLRRLYRVFTYIYPLLIEKDNCDSRNVSVKLLFVYVCLSSRDFVTFSVSFSSFFSYFFVIRTSVFSLSTGFLKDQYYVLYIDRIFS